MKELTTKNFEFTPSLTTPSTRPRSLLSPSVHRRTLPSSRATLNFLPACFLAIYVHVNILQKKRKTRGTRTSVSWTILRLTFRRHAGTRDGAQNFAKLWNLPINLKYGYNGFYIFRFRFPNAPQKSQNYSRNSISQIPSIFNARHNFAISDFAQNTRLPKHYYLYTNMICE